MSGVDDSLYSGDESSVYSYKDLALYQYSDAEEDESSANPPQPTTNKKAVIFDRIRNSNNRENHHNGNYDDDADADALWNWEDNGSYVIYAQSSVDDEDDEFELYQFSDEDLIPEEPDEEWIVAALLNNRRDYDHLELLLGEIDDFSRLIDAIQSNRIVQNVTIYESFFDAIPTPEQKTVLAEAVCQLQHLEQLKVYYHSSYFVEPLERIRPPNLKRLCLMFFPGRASKDTLATLTNFLKENGSGTTGSSTGKDDNDAPHNSSSSDINNKKTNSNSSLNNNNNNNINNPPANALLMLESLSLRCDLMDDNFIQAIANGMEDNSTLTTLSFWGNNVQVTEKGSAASAKIDFFLRLNQCGIRDLHLLVNATPNEFLDKVVNERESLDLVFYLLQSNPSFLSYCTLL